MTNEPNDLAALWQSGVAARTTDELLGHVEHEERHHRLLKGLFFTIGVVVTLAVAYIELTGSIKVPGILAVIVAASGWIHWNQYHARRQSERELAKLSPREMLEFSLKDATQNLSLARGMHSVFPAGALSGYFTAPLILSDRPWYEPPEWLDTTLIVIIAITLLTSVIAGHWIASRAKRRIRVLEARLKEFDGAL